MALKLRKDLKKSLYYVWFLGAKESKGLRGSEFVLPVIQHLEEREKDVEPFKVTLQVSHKGLKIIQNIVTQGSKSSKPKTETIKHFIPHNTITCVHQREDIVACILLLFNPVTKCPLHVHAYRCDSLETAGLLRQQLQTLIERPENQKKFADIEMRLKMSKEQPRKSDSSVESDAGNSTRESESSEERYSTDNTRVATLYDSVAAELRAKLCKNDVPILLPPRDYDTVHRQKGNLTGIELRRCLNANIVGQNVKNGRKLESSGGSSGIGSDHAPSPESPDAPDSRFNTIDNHSTSDEEWNADNNGDTSYYLMNNPLTLPRFAHPQQQQQEVANNKNERLAHARNAHKIEEKNHQDAAVFYREDMNKEPPHGKKYHSRDYNSQRHVDEWYERNGNRKQHYETDKNGHWNSKCAYQEDDGFEETNFRSKTLERMRRYAYDEDDVIDEEEDEPPVRRPVPKTRQNHSQQYYPDEYSSPKPKFRADDPKFYAPEPKPERRQRSPSPPEKVSPRDRFKDAKEKFLLLERARVRQQQQQEVPIAPVVHRDKTFLKRHESLVYAPVKDERRFFEEQPRAAPRSTHSEEVRFRRDVPLERYRGAEKYDPKRRSMFSLVEEEHRKNSTEIAKELKRRSYMDAPEDAIYRDRSYNNDIPEGDRYSRDTYRTPETDKVGELKTYAKNQKNNNAAGYRHSYAEPKMRMEKKHFQEVLHRTNSSVSSGRVGLASVQPY